MGDNETMDGALERAKNALKADPDASFGIGLEGGVNKIGDRWFESGWICIISRDGEIGWGSSGRYEMSRKIMKRLLNGEELASVIDDLSGQSDVRSSQGAMGILTNGQLPRALSYSHGVIFAFAPFVSDEVYWK